MELRTWRKQTKHTYRSLTEALGITPGHLWKIEAGQKRPSWDLVARIHEVTGGAVSADDFMPPTTVAKKPQTQAKVL